MSERTVINSDGSGVVYDEKGVVQRRFRPQAGRKEQPKVHRTRRMVLAGWAATINECMSYDRTVTAKVGGQLMQGRVRSCVRYPVPPKHDGSNLKVTLDSGQAFRLDDVTELDMI